MIKAFIFGKFLPFHKGHEAMINFALKKCNFLTVLICCSDKENFSSEKRKNWLEKTFENTKNIEIKIFNYFEEELPNTSESSIKVSKIWSKKFKDFFPDYNLVITSENYGDYVASYMNIEHIPFDLKKIKYPISASTIRNNFSEYWNFLPNSVKPDFAIKIVILGTESTGKTTLTKKLAKYFKCNYMREIGRDLIANSNSFNFEDLHLVASEHAKEINKITLGKSQLIIIDTDIHITKSYANFIFNKDLIIEKEIYNSNKANLYLYLNNDVEHLQDGTRFNETNRNLLDISHRKILHQNNIKFTEINGNWNQRFEKAIYEINKVLISINKQYSNIK